MLCVRPGTSHPGFCPRRAPRLGPLASTLRKVSADY